MRKCGPIYLMLETQTTDHRPHILILSCVITYGYFWVSHMWQPGNPVQSHWLQILLCKRSYILKPGSYDINTLYGHNKAVTEQLSCIMKNFI